MEITPGEFVALHSLIREIRDALKGPRLDLELANVSLNQAQEILEAMRDRFRFELPGLDKPSYD
jgi:hypothetical protein